MAPVFGTFSPWWWIVCESEFGGEKNKKEDYKIF